MSDDIKEVHHYEKHLQDWRNFSHEALGRTSDDWTNVQLQVQVPRCAHQVTNQAVDDAADDIKNSAELSIDACIARNIERFGWSKDHQFAPVYERGYLRGRRLFAR